MDPEGLRRRRRYARLCRLRRIQADYRTADFHAFEGGAVSEEVRIYGGREDAGTGTPERPVSENLEPEYSAVIGGRA